MINADIRILLVEDNPGDARLVAEALAEVFFGQVIFSHVETLKSAISLIYETPVDLILLDLSLPDSQGLSTFSSLYQANSEVPIVILTGMNNEDLALNAVKQGAQDYLLKSELQGSAFSRVIRYSIERKLAENTLKASEARYRGLFENANDVIFTLNLEGKFTSLNRACEKIMGYASKELIGRYITDFLTGETIGSVAGMLRSALMGIFIATYDLEIVAKDGSTRILDVSSRPFYRGQSLIGIESIARDVTERKRAAIEMQQLNQRLEAQNRELTALYNATSILFEGNNLPVLLRQIAQVIYKEFGHEAACIMLLDESQKLVLQTLYFQAEELEASPTIAPDDLAVLLKRIEAQEYVHLEDSEGKLFFPASQPALSSEFALPLRTSNGLVGMLMVASDQPDAFNPKDRRIMTAFAERTAYALENTRLNEALTRHAGELEWQVARRTAEVNRIRERIEAILNSSSDPIMLTDAKGTIMQTNPAFERMFGYDSNEVFYQPLSMLVESDHADKVTTAVNTLIETNQVEGIEVVYRRKDGITRNGEIDLALLKTNPSEPDQVGIVCIVHDITQHKQTQAWLSEALRTERELGELKSRFVSMVSHEFRTPLAVIQVSSDLLRKYSDRMADERRNEHHENIQSQVLKLRELLDDVLTISKADTVGLEFNPVAVNLPQFCFGLVEEMRPIAGAHRFEMQVADNFPQVMADAKLLRQGVMNLLSNALKYSPPDSSVHVTLLHDDQWAVLKIRDEGIGIPEEDQQRLFEVFHRARNAQDIQGSGLGLAIVKRAIEAHGGSITVESTVNVGTTFTIALPVMSAEHQSE